MENKLIARELYSIYVKNILVKGPHTFLEMADWISENFVPLKVDGGIDWIDQWLEMFPEGVKSAGKKIRGDRELCTKKMKAFMKKYPYTPSEILEATQEYLDERSLKNYEYTMLSNNFIDHREKGSLLAEKCKELRKERKQTFVKVNSDFI